MSPPLVTLHPLTSFFVGSLVSSVVLFLLKFCQFIFNHSAIYWPLISRFLFCHFQWISVLIYIFSPLFLDGFCELTGDQHSQLHWPLSLLLLPTSYLETHFLFFLISHVLWPPPLSLHIFISPVEHGFYPYWDHQPRHIFLFFPLSLVLLTLFLLFRLLPLFLQMLSVIYPPIPVLSPTCPSPQTCQPKFPFSSKLLESVDRKGPIWVHMSIMLLLSLKIFKRILKSLISL